MDTITLRVCTNDKINKNRSHYRPVEIQSQVALLNFVSRDKKHKSTQNDKMLEFMLIGVSTTRFSVFYYSLNRTGVISVLLPSE